MTYNKSFPDRLILARAKSGMTQKALSLATKISLPQIVRYEGGRSYPRLSAILRLCKALGVSPNDLTPDLNSARRKIVVEFTEDEYAALMLRFQCLESEIASFIKHTALMEFR